MTTQRSEGGRNDSGVRLQAPNVVNTRRPVRDGVIDLIANVLAKVILSLIGRKKSRHKRRNEARPDIPESPAFPDKPPE